MLEWKPRLVLLLVALAGLASIMSLLHIAPANYGWTGHAGTAVAPTGFGAMPSFGTGPLPP